VLLFVRNGFIDELETFRTDGKLCAIGHGQMGSNLLSVRHELGLWTHFADEVASVTPRRTHELAGSTRSQVADRN
jgi:hypothetical protein